MQHYRNLLRCLPKVSIKEENVLLYQGDKNKKMELGHAF
jgi:hypothetical protein